MTFGVKVVAVTVSIGTEFVVVTVGVVRKIGSFGFGIAVEVVVATVGVVRIIGSFGFDVVSGLITPIGGVGVGTLDIV